MVKDPAQIPTRLAIKLTNGWIAVIDTAALTKLTDAETSAKVLFPISIF